MQMRKFSKNLFTASIGQIYKSRSHDNCSKKIHNHDPSNYNIFYHNQTFNNDFDNPLHNNVFYNIPKNQTLDNNLKNYIPKIAHNVF